MSTAGKAQQHAVKTLVMKYRTEYEELYRAEVTRLGGNVRPTKELRIARLKAQIEQLESEGV